MSQQISPPTIQPPPTPTHGAALTSRLYPPVFFVFLHPMDLCDGNTKNLNLNITFKNIQSSKNIIRPGVSWFFWGSAFCFLRSNQPRRRILGEIGGQTDRVALAFAVLQTIPLCRYSCPLLLGWTFYVCFCLPAFIRIHSSNLLFLILTPQKTAAINPSDPHQQIARTCWWSVSSC